MVPVVPVGDNRNINPGRRHQMNAQKTFPQDLFDLLAHEAIEDLGKTGLSYEEAYQILENFLGPQFAQRFDKKLRSSSQ